MWVSRKRLESIESRLERLERGVAYTVYEELAPELRAYYQYLNHVDVGLRGALDAVLKHLGIKLVMKPGAAVSVEAKKLGEVKKQKDQNPKLP